MCSSITVGHLSTFYHTSFILEGTNWLREAGIDAKWLLFASGPDIIKAFQRGDIDMGYLGLPPVIIGVSKGATFRCVAGGHIEGTVMVAKEEYEGFDSRGDINKVLKQFEGKVVGTPPRGSIHDVIAHDIVEKLGLNIRIENYPWADFVLQAIVDGDIPAAFGTPPLAVAARRLGNAKIVIPPSRLWPNNPSYGIVASEDMMRQSEIIMKFLELHERACKLSREKPHEAAEIVSRLTQTVDVDFVQETYMVSPKYCAALSQEFVQSTMDFVGALKRLGYIDRLVTEDEIFDRRFINKVHPEPPHYESI